MPFGRLYLCFSSQIRSVVTGVINAAANGRTDAQLLVLQMGPVFFFSPVSWNPR